MRRIIIMLAAFALLLCACSNGGSNPHVRTVTKVPGYAGTALPRQIIFAVDSGADEILVSAAESFCRKVNSLSEGSFVLTLEKSPDALRELKSGNAGFAFIDGDKAAGLHPYFAITSERFRYSSYENFSMVCNSGRVLSKLSDVSGVKVFAAYYTGSNVFAGLSPLDETFATERGAEPDAPVREIELFTVPGSGTDAVFKLPAVTRSAAEGLSGRMRMMYIDDTAVEFSLSELLPSQISTAVSGEKESLVITRTFHSITPVWLIISPSLYEILPPFDRAAVDEAAAYIPGNVDGEYLRLEQERLDALEEEGAAISSAFTSTRTKILRLSDDEQEDIPAGENYFRELLQRI